MNKKRQRNRLFTMLLLVMAVFMPYVGAWAQETTKGNGSKLILKDAKSPTITLNSNETTISQLAFTITVSANNEEQKGTSLVTYYTTDGSDPEDSSNEKRKKLTQSPEVVTVGWKSGDKVKVRAFTMRVDNSDATNYDDSKEATQDFHNTGSAELPCVDDPVITPGDQAVVAGKLYVTINHDQWTKALDSKLNIYYIKYERNDDGTITQGNPTKAPSLPLNLTLTKSSTVKAYAVFTDDANNNTKYEEVSRTYILLDEATTYLNTERTKAVGTTVEKNGMTMTYGGIADGTNNFTRFSNVDYSEDNILGSLHAVTSTTLYLNKDAASENRIRIKKIITTTKKLQPRNSTKEPSDYRQRVASTSLSLKSTETSRYSWSSREQCLNLRDSYIPAM